jgi:predicted RNase H-like nuclease (RuvC/YqgF family)
MIDDNSLTQVFATVLAGVLIFLTLERRFGGVKEAIDKVNALQTRKNFLRQELDNLVTQKDYCIDLKGKTEKAQAGPNDDKPRKMEESIYKQKIASFEKTIEEKEAEIQKKTSELRLTDFELKWLDSRIGLHVQRYTDLKTKEGIITLSMIVLLSGSILIMILSSTAFTYIPSVIQRDYDFISSIVFSSGIVLLIMRVHLHGKQTYASM